MENRRRFWSRFVSRLRRNHSGYHSRRPVRRYGRPSLSPTDDTSHPAHYFRFLWRPAHTRFRHVDSGNADWFVMNRLESSFRQGFTPKCLTEIDPFEMVYGDRSDDLQLTHNWWSESHLQRFGAINSDTRTDNPEISEIENTHLLPNDNFMSENETSPMPLVNNENSSNISVGTRSSQSYNTQSGSNEGQLSANSTISDITRFYNSVNLTGATFERDAVTPEPPPYSEFPDDPPPPYSETLEVPVGRSQTTTSQRASIQLVGDLLY